MYKDEFKDRYTTIAFAIDKTDCQDEVKEIITHQHQEIELIAITEGSAEFYIDSQKISHSQRGYFNRSALFSSSCSHQPCGGEYILLHLF